MGIFAKSASIAWLVFAAWIGAAAAQPPAPESEPPLLGPVCLTNACGGVAVDFTGATPARTVAQAIALGNARAVKDLGGTPQQAAQALARRSAARVEQGGEMFAEGASRFAAFADTSGGATLSWAEVAGPPGPNGEAFVGSVERRNPDGTTQVVMLTADGGAMLMLPGVAPPPYPSNGTGLAPRQR